MASIARSIAPSATSMCCQKSPKPRARTRACCSATSSSAQPGSSHPVGERHADLGLVEPADGRHAARPAAGERAEPAGRPPPPAERRRRHDADDRPVSTCVSAINVAHTGMPRTKLDVPSIGSMIQRHGDVGVADEPCSSPNKPSSGRCGQHLDGDRRLRLAVGLGDLGVVGLPVEVERSLLVVRQRDRDRRSRPVRGRTTSRRRGRDRSAHRGNSGGRRSRSAASPRRRPDRGS